MKDRRLFDAQWPERFKMGYVNRPCEAIVTSIRQGKFHSQLTRTLAYFEPAVKQSNRIFRVRFSCRRVL